MSRATCRVVFGADYTPNGGLPATLVRRGRGGPNGDVVRMSTGNAKKLLRRIGRVRQSRGKLSVYESGSGETFTFRSRKGKVVIDGFQLVCQRSKRSR